MHKEACGVFMRWASFAEGTVDHSVDDEDSRNHDETREKNAATHAHRPRCTGACSSGCAPRPRGRWLPRCRRFGGAKRPAAGTRRWCRECCSRLPAAGIAFVNADAGTGIDAFVMRRV
jgi:hypothetical protein